MRKKILAFAAAAFAVALVAPIAVPAQAQEIRRGDLGSALQPFVDQQEIAGAVALVATRNRIVQLAAVGVSDLETHRAMRTDDIFWIASMSKPIAGIAIGILKDRGKLSFDDPVARFIPSFAKFRAPDGHPLTLRHLLTHTGGLGEQMQRGPHLTLAQTAEMAAALPLRYEVGSRWSYSTLGIDVLGRVAEIASGMPLDAFLDRNLFVPLGMKDTGFWIAPRNLPRYARSYSRKDSGPLERAEIPYLYGTDPTDRGRPPLLGAGLFSTAPDLVRVYQMMLNRGSWHNRRILKPGTVTELTAKQTGTLAARPGMPWGLGFSIVEDPTKMEANATLSPGTFGHGGAFGTTSWADPATATIYVLMLQRAGLANPDNSAMRIAYQRAARAQAVRAKR